MKAVLKPCFSSWSQLMWTGASAADTGSAIRVFSHYGRVKEWGTDQSWLSAGSSRPKTDKHNHPTLRSPQRLHYWKQSERRRQWARVNQKDFLFLIFFFFRRLRNKVNSSTYKTTIKTSRFMRRTKKKKEWFDRSKFCTCTAQLLSNRSLLFWENLITPCVCLVSRRAKASGNRRGASRGQLVSFCCCPFARPLDKITFYGPLCSFGCSVLHTNQVWYGCQRAKALIAGSGLQSRRRRLEANRLLTEDCFDAQETLSHEDTVHRLWQVCPLSPACVMTKGCLQFAIRTKRGQSHTVKERPWPDIKELLGGDLRGSTLAYQRTRSKCRGIRDVICVKNEKIYGSQYIEIIKVCW